MSRVEQFERIRRDHREEGLSIRSLARRHKVHRRVVRQALASAVPPKKQVSDRPCPAFGPYEEIVRRWLTEDKSVPKKQRHTARRVWQRLVAEHGARIAESTVRERVRVLKEEVADPPEAMIPQLHGPGEEAEVDFGEFWAYLAGEYVKLWLFSLRLSASGRAFHRVYATQAQEAFFSGHVHAFEAMGGTPRRIRYDNLKPAVARALFGRDRIESERFIAFRSHYGFDSFYCRPGIKGAHEKGGVEQDIGWFRRNHLVPVPRVASLGELNGLLDRYDSEDLARPGDRGAPGDRR
jgi:transposase